MNIKCVSCGRPSRHYCCGKCRNCYYFDLRLVRVKNQPRKDDRGSEMTDEELDALIKSQMKTMPPEWAEAHRRQEGFRDDTARRVAGVLRVLLAKRGLRI